MPVTATNIKSGAGLEQIVEAKLPDGTTVEVSIPAPLCIAITTVTQAFLMRSMAAAQTMGGVALLPVTRLALHRRNNDQSLALETDNLGAIAFQMTPDQWRELEGIVLAAQRGAPGVH